MHNPAPAGTSTVTAALEPPPPLPPPQDGSSKPPPTPRLSHNGKTDLPDCPLYVSTRRCPKDHRNCPLNHPVLPKLKKKNKYHGPATREVPNRVCNCILYGKCVPMATSVNFCIQCRLPISRCKRRNLTSIPWQHSSSSSSSSDSFTRLQQSRFKNLPVINHLLLTHCRRTRYTHKDRSNSIICHHLSNINCRPKLPISRYNNSSIKQSLKQGQDLTGFGDTSFDTCPDTSRSRTCILADFASCPVTVTCGSS